MCEGCGREDFREKEYAEGLGFEVEFHPQDVRHGRTDIHGRRVPNDALRFHLKVWAVVPGGEDLVAGARGAVGRVRLRPKVRHTQGGSRRRGREEGWSQCVRRGGW
jgi:hypothetical protein